MTTRATRHLIEVSAISDITAWYRRISFDPLGLFGFYRPAPAAYLMLTVPTLDGQGRVQRAYSLVGQPGQTCAFDFVLHHPVGPASQWAAQAEPGRRLAVTEPPYHLAIPPVGHATIIGDTSAVAAIGSLLAGLDPAMSATVLLEDDHPDRDRLPLPQRDRTTIRWIDRLSPADLAEAATAAPTDRFIWAAGERHLTRLAKDYARDQDLPRANQAIQTYWIAGTAAG